MLLRMLRWALAVPYPELDEIAYPNDVYLDLPGWIAEKMQRNGHWQAWREIRRGLHAHPIQKAEVEMFREKISREA